MDGEREIRAEAEREAGGWGERERDERNEIETNGGRKIGAGGRA